jgi:hypothetical protein
MRLPLTRRVPALLVATSMLAGAAPAAGSERTIRCDSRGFGHNYCRVDTDNRVTLVERHGLIACNEGRSWGYDRSGVWVDKGCSATFRVGKHDSDKAVIGAVVGLAALAALAASRQKSEATEVVSWAVGSFSGADRREGVDVALRILPGGQVTGRAGGKDITGHLQGQRLEAGRQLFRIERQGNGFLAVDERDDGHRVTFKRIDSGY